ncbi:thymopoietin isoform X1 [Ascaphus truei]|uniref:thymopoietin isoform X1 n=1 Tax=Ascaphus truei TaxID=8439 RepID=UPI003F59565B
MSEFLEDPSVLTKEKLKSELVANNVSLPAGEQRKDVYVQLYLQHLTYRNRGPPDFSSDEEREATPARRGRPGRKATKKTDKPIAEEKDDLDVTELTNNALKDELIKYGLKPGPILENTRKVYEQRLLKLKEQSHIVVSSTPLVADSSTAEDNKQNGNTDSEHYSDNEEESKIDQKLEKREPLKGRPKAQVTLRNRRVEQNETVEDTDDIPELNVKRSSRSPPNAFTPDGEDLSNSPPVKPLHVVFHNNFSHCTLNISENVITEETWTTGSTKSGRLQAVFKESTKVTRRTPRKKVVTEEQVPFDDADISEAASVTETIKSSTNQTLAYAEYEHFESRKVANQVTESFKYADPLPALSDFSDLSRTPKKNLVGEKHLNLLQQAEAGSPHKRVIDVDNIGYTKSSDLLNTALIEFVEKTFTEERRTERDILKEMFPHQASTPTGISASCRRPIKGAAGRPLNPKDFIMEESFSSKYVPKYTSVVELKSEKVKTGRSIPMWIKFLLFVIVAVFSFLVYQAMETNEGNYFSKYLLSTQESQNIKN